MALYIITTSSIDVISFTRVLKNLGTPYFLTDNCSLLESPLSFIEIRDYIRENSNVERIFVSKISYGAAWSNILTPSKEIKELYTKIK